MRNNRLAQLPDQLCDLRKLIDLKLDYNFLNALPNDLHKLQRLEHLSVSQNNLKSIPPQMYLLQSNLRHVILNDNKITQVPAKFGNLTRLLTLLLHNNHIVDIPSSFYRLKHLNQLSLDWFAFLHNDNIQINTKHLKGQIINEDSKKEDMLEAQKHKRVIDEFIQMCALVHILEMKKTLEERQQQMHKNPQQDDFEPTSSVQLYQTLRTHKDIPQQIMKGVTSKRREKNQGQAFDPLMCQKAVKINFLKFLMFFNNIAQIDTLIMKALFPNKQRKLSHLIASFGQQYLLKDVLKQIDLYHHNCLNKDAQHAPEMSSFKALKILQTQHQFLNSIDRDFSTPLILALKNKRMGIVRALMEHPKTCLKQASMKYGTPLHVAVANQEFKTAINIMKLQKQQKDFNFAQEINKLDEEGNTTMHFIMKNFNSDPESSSKIARSLIKKGINLKYKNKIQMTPLHVALYYAQNEGIKFALKHNYMLRRSKNENNYQMFDFQEQAGKMQLSPLHYAVYQSNFNLLSLLLNSEEDIDHEAEDLNGRRPIDLCKSISSIFKTLRSQLRSKKAALVQNNMKMAELED